MSIIKKFTNNKCCQGCGEKETLGYHWLECKLVQPLRKIVWRFFKKLKVEQPCMHAKLLQWCPTLRDPMDHSLPGSSVHGDSPGKNTGVEIVLCAIQEVFAAYLFYVCCCCCQVASVVSDSVRPHRWQPTRLSPPWDSPGKNTGVGCHFLLQFMKVKSESEVAESCPTLSDPMDCSPPRSSAHWILQARVLEWGAIAFSDSYH